MKCELAVTGVGIVNAAGLGLDECWDAVETDQTALTLQRIPDLARAPLAGGQVMSWIPQIRAKRLAALAEMAIEEALQDARAEALLERGGRVAVLCGQSDAEVPGFRFPVDTRELEQWAQEIRLPGLSVVEARPGGRCSALAGLARAEQLLASGAADLCIVGAVDSLLHLKAVRYFERRRCLKTSYRNDGFIPGEGAAFLVVERRAQARERAVDPLAHIVSLAGATEPQTSEQSSVLTGNALTDVCRVSLADSSSDSARLASVWSDLNGESYRAREWAYASIRLQLSDDTRLRHPVDVFGDLGAAMGATLLGLAARDVGARREPDSAVLVFAGEGSGTRAACVLKPGGRAQAFPKPNRQLPGLYPVADRYPLVAVQAPELAQSTNPARDLALYDRRMAHRDDLSALYYQRTGLLQSPEEDWRAASRIEERLLRHCDAVVSQGARAIGELLAGVARDEAGAPFAAGLLGGMLPGTSFLEAAAALPDDTRALLAFREGLAHAPNGAVFDWASRWAGSTDSRFGRLGIYLLGYRRRAESAQLHAGLATDDVDLLGDVFDAIRRGVPEALKSAVAAFGTEVPGTVLEPYLNCLYRYREAGLRELCRTLAERYPEESAPLLMLAIQGDQADTDQLLVAARRRPELHLAALGVFGYPAVLEPLLEHAAVDGPHVRVATRALALMLGPQIRTPEGALDPRARERLQERASGTQIATGRYRLGQPISAKQCLAELAGARSGLVDRNRALSEFIVYSGQVVHFEPDAFVPRQLEALERFAGIA
ncbi:MAG: beta-ketoacyl synthase N-terminal-like domain-containing protein [Pseudomonadota bacterium]